MSRNMHSKGNDESQEVEVFNTISDDVRSRLEIIDLEDDESSETVEVYNVVPDNIRSRLEVLDLDD